MRSSVRYETLTSNHKVRYELKTPYCDGTTHVIFNPLDFIACTSHPPSAARAVERYGGHAKVIASIEDPQVIEKIVTHLKQREQALNQIPLPKRLPEERAPPVHNDSDQVNLFD